MLTNILKNKKGFTFIELIVVVIIIGIVAGIVIPSFSSIKNTKLRGCQLLQRTIEGTVRQFLAEHPNVSINDMDASDSDAIYALLINYLPSKPRPSCPDGGTLSLVNGVVQCSKHAHF